MENEGSVLNADELKRYQRHLILEGFGTEAQEKLKAARVLMVGAGGLGCPALQYLTAAGVGRITIIDPDKIEISNLQRQILYTTADLGKPKAIAAKEKLEGQNPFVNINAITESLSAENTLALFADHDVVIDGTDNFATRYLCNDASVLTDKPLVYGAIQRFQGQVSVFNWQGSATYRCLFPEPPSADEAPDCSTAGVLGVLPGVIGTLQANECIKLITGIGAPLANKLLVMNLLNMETQLFSFKKNISASPIIRLMDDYQEFCNNKKPMTSTSPKSISGEELALWIKENKDFQLLDVRENWEREIAHIGGLHIPMQQLNSENTKAFDKQKPTVVYCHHGIRSRSVSNWLAEQGFQQVLNLEGGIHAWSLEVDENIEMY